VKKRLGALTAVLGVWLLAAGPASAANNNSVVITVNSTVAQDCAVTLDSGGTNETYNFPDLTAGANNVQVGTVTERCNNSTGYKVTLTSANKSNLLGSSTGAKIAYTLTYGGAAVNLTSGSATVTNATTKTATGGVTDAVLITFAGGFLVADTYSDTLTFTMSAN
jgi:hypothetical protein